MVLSSLARVRLRREADDDRQQRRERRADWQAHRTTHGYYRMCIDFCRRRWHRRRRASGEDMKKKLGHATAGNRTMSIAANDLRWSILDEERLRWSIAHEENLRQSAPDTWRVWEASRLQQEREKAA